MYLLLNIDNELRDLIPALTTDEYEQLEQNILEEGNTTKAKGEGQNG